MKKKVIYLFIIFTATILQTSSAVFFLNHNWPADIILMLVLAWTLIDGFEEFLPWAIVAGLFYDLAYFSPIGTHILILAVLSYCLSFFSKRFSLEIRGTGLLLVMAFVVGTTLGSRIITVALEFGVDALKTDLENFRILIGVFLSSALLNLVIFFGLYFMIRKIEKFFRLKQKRVPIDI